MWDNCGMARSDGGPAKSPRSHPGVTGGVLAQPENRRSDEELNQTLEKANRVSDFLEIAELMCLDTLDRRESRGGHFRVESQTAEGEAETRRYEFQLHRGLEWKGPDKAPALHKEPLTFEYVPLSQRSYK